MVRVSVRPISGCLRRVLKVYSLFISKVGALMCFSRIQRGKIGDGLCRMRRNLIEAPRTPYFARHQEA
jgi:hypothetical protein